MFRYTIRRLLQGIITVWFIATATFVAMHSVPGDPLIQNKAVTAQIRKNLEIKYGLDKPITQQYLIYMGNMLKGDFGISYTQQNRSVNDIIVKHFPVSATLGILAIVFAAIGGILWGALTALYRNRLPDIVIMFLVILGISVPSFVFAALGQLALVHLNALAGRTLLPVAGWGTVSHMFVPSIGERWPGQLLNAALRGYRFEGVLRQGVRQLAGFNGAHSSLTRGSTRPYSRSTMITISTRNAP
jgi:ABC-type dipeptide/oligopeptide/nickel transport system permease component